MSIKKYKKEDLELLSNKDITYLLLEEKANQATADLYKKIIKLLELPESTFDQKIGDYYIALTNDKRFILLDNGKWDLKSRHTTDKIKKIDLEDDEEELIEDDSNEEDYVGDFDYDEKEDEYDDSSEEDLKDLIIIDEDELGLEE